MVLETVLMVLPFMIGVAVAGRRGLEIVGTLVAVAMVLFAFVMRGLWQPAFAAFITIAALSATSFAVGVLLGARLPRLQTVGLGGVSLVSGGLFTATLAGQLQPPVRNRTVQTAMWVDGDAQSTFDALKQFAALPGEQPLSMQLGMPTPQRCELKAEAVGSHRVCQLEEGRVEQVVTTWDPPRQLQLTVLATYAPRRLGNSMTTGYVLTPQGAQTHVMRTTEYISSLAPAWFWEPLERRTIDDEHRLLFSGLLGRVVEIHGGVPVRLTVKTNPPTEVTVIPPSSSGRPRLELGRTPLDGQVGAMVGDTVLMENDEHGIHSEELIEFGQPDELKLIMKTFKQH